MKKFDFKYECIFDKLNNGKIIFDELISGEKLNLTMVSSFFTIILYAITM